MKSRRMWDCLAPLHPEVLAEEGLVLRVLVEALRRQHAGQHRHLRLELHLHESGDYCVGDEFVHTMKRERANWRVCHPIMRRESASRGVRATSQAGAVPREHPIARRARLSAVLTIGLLPVSRYRPKH
jgi:hypothetical protein